MWALNNDTVCAPSEQENKTGYLGVISSNNNNSASLIRSALWIWNIFIYGYLWEATDELFLFDASGSFQDLVLNDAQG